MNNDRLTRCRCGASHSATPVDRERRAVLGLLALTALGPLAACSDDKVSSASTAPVEISRSTSCELDGMLLMDYPGPKGQIHFADADRPAFYCDTLELLNTLLMPEQVRKIKAVYVQDMGKANWDNPEGAWIDARTAMYVQGSKRKGSMGPTFASFSADGDARRFVAEFGGTVLKMAEITPVMVDLRGGANLDGRM